jgi:hypothetical protein
MKFYVWMTIWTLLIAGCIVYFAGPHVLAVIDSWQYPAVRALGG